MANEIWPWGFPMTADHLRSERYLPVESRNIHDAFIPQIKIGDLAFKQVGVAHLWPLISVNDYKGF